MEFIEWNDATENMANIGDLDTRETDEGADSNLHEESYYRWDFYPTLAYSIEIIDK